MVDFSYAEHGMSRFPPNVEQLTVEHESTATWLVARRNDILLRFPLGEADRDYLAGLLLDLGADGAEKCAELRSGQERLRRSAARQSADR